MSCECKAKCSEGKFVSGETTIGRRGNERELSWSFGRWKSKGERMREENYSHKHREDEIMRIDHHNESMRGGNKNFCIRALFYSSQQVFSLFFFLAWPLTFNLCHGK